MRIANFGLQIEATVLCLPSSEPLGLRASEFAIPRPGLRRLERSTRHNLLTDHGR